MYLDRPSGGHPWMSQGQQAFALGPLFENDKAFGSKQKFNKMCYF